MHWNISIPIRPFQLPWVSVCTPDGIFKEVLQGGVVDIIQPDLSHAGGISEVRRIAAMAEAYDVALAPHCPLGPVSLASALHIDFTCINAFIQESSLGIHYNKGYELLDYMENPEVFDLKGRVHFPSERARFGD